MTGNDFDGTLIAIEGIDGAGKTTVRDAIAEEIGDDVVRTKEPTDMWTGKQVYRALSSDDENPLTDFFMFMADRTKHVKERVAPALEDGKVVLCDRYVGSTRAYQTHRIAEEVGETTNTAVEWMEAVFGLWNVEADIVVYIDIPVETAMERCAGMDKYERRENLQKVRSTYRWMYDFDPRVVHVDGTQSKEAVVEEAVDGVTDLMENGVPESLWESSE